MIRRPPRSTQSRSSAASDVYKRQVWHWGRSNWQGLRDALDKTEWNSILDGDVDDQTLALTRHLVTLQSVFVPHEDYTTRPVDQPWFGPHCKAAADNKARAWVSYKRSPTSRNKQLHTAACTRMKRAQKWAIARWKEDLRTKLIGQSVGGKSWWSCIKQH